MANISYKKSTTEKFDVKGYLDASASTITYIEKDKDGETEVVLDVQTFLNKFAGSNVQITIQNKSEEELKLDSENTSDDN